MASGSGIKQDALANYGVQGNTASSAYDIANPVYEQEVNDPYGLTPQQKTNQLTASGQSLGGSVAGAVGQGGLLAARTGNAGGASAAIDDAARQAGVTQSGNALGVENQDALLARQQQTQGLDGERSIYDTATGAGISDLNAANNASSSFLKQLLLQSVSSAGAAAPTIAKALGG